MAEMFRMFPLSPGLVDGKHRQNMGLAIWEFLWFLEHVTSDESDGKGRFDGVIDWGNSISAARVARELASNARCVQRNIQKLVSAGYLVRKRAHANGSSYVVTNSKRWLWKREHRAGNPTTTQSEGATEKYAGVRTNPSPDATDSVTRRDGKVRSNKERKSRRAEEKNKILKPSPDGVVKNPTSNLSRSKARDRGKRPTKSSNLSGVSSTDRGKENSVAADATAAAKPSSPGELILIPPEPSSPPKEDRHSAVARVIKSKYQEVNGVLCAWNGRAGKALKDFLDEHPGWTTEKITQCVTNRFKSVGVALSDDPHFWIPKLASFLQGPKDKFGKTTTEPAVVPQTKAPHAIENVPPIAQPDKRDRIARWKNSEASPNFLEEPHAIGRVQ